ncbi:MAG: HepT-like ribonuclease domain-containing protein [Candidatus Latescibacterota bacterium]
MIGMRHRLVHAYFDINLDILWRTLQDDLPALATLLEPSIKSAEPY